MTEQQAEDQKQGQPQEQAKEQVQEQTEEKQADEKFVPHQLTQEELDSMTYFEYLKFLNPDKTDEEIAAMERKENRNVWVVRFQLLAFLIIAIIIIWLIFFAK